MKQKKNSLIAQTMPLGIIWALLCRRHFPSLSLCIPSIADLYMHVSFGPYFVVATLLNPLRE